MSLSYKNPISGERVVNPNPLLPEHIQVRRLLWFAGDTSTYSWNCPARITRVDTDNRIFYVRSFDDMKELSTPFPFVANDSSDYSRKSMRLTTEQEVQGYLENRRKVLLQNVQNKQTELELAEKALDTFDTHTPKLSLA